MYRFVNYYLFLFLIAVSIISCKKEEEKFKSKELKGVYEVDFSSLIDAYAEQKERENQDQENGGNNFESFGIGAAKILLATVNVKIHFDGKTGKFDVDGGLAEMIANASNKDLDLSNDTTFEYEIRNDSLFFIKREGETDFKEAAIIRKKYTSYDIITLVLSNEKYNKNELQINLEKVAEE